MKKIILPFLLVLFLASCTSYKKLVYVNNLEKSDQLYPKKITDYRLQKNDILYIRIFSPNEEMNLQYNPVFGGSVSMGSIGNNGSMYLFGYNVSDSGTISLPPLGKVQVAGLTVTETEKKIQELVDASLKNAQVVVKLAEFRFAVLGEVLQPGARTWQGNQLNIFQAIASAGDVTYYGKRKEVVIIRQEETGSRSFSVDLTNPNLLASEGYYLQPNDIIYVKPTHMRAMRVNLGDYLLLLGTITSTITAAFLVLKF